jgi:hypothetical protein
MKLLAYLAVMFAAVGCSTPNPHPQATAEAYKKVQVGMTRHEVYALLGAPRSTRPAGDIQQCEIAVWGIPHDSHGWGRWKVVFDGDRVSDVTPLEATASGHVSR